MEITYNEAKLKAYLDSAFERDSKNPVLDRQIFSW